jgi:hypothetical protein
MGKGDGMSLRTKNAGYYSSQDYFSAIQSTVRSHKKAPAVKQVPEEVSATVTLYSVSFFLHKGYWS